MILGNQYTSTEGYSHCNQSPVSTEEFSMVWGCWDLERMTKLEAQFLMKSPSPL